MGCATSRDAPSSNRPDGRKKKKHTGKKVPTGKSSEPGKKEKKGKKPQQAAQSPLIVVDETLRQPEAKKETKPPIDGDVNLAQFSTLRLSNRSNSSGTAGPIPPANRAGSGSGSKIEKFVSEGSRSGAQSTLSTLSTMTTGQARNPLKAATFGSQQHLLPKNSAVSLKSLSPVYER